jgi:hypothetical protein
VIAFISSHAPGFDRASVARVVGAASKISRGGRQRGLGNAERDELLILTVFGLLAGSLWIAEVAGRGRKRV